MLHVDDRDFSREVLQSEGVVVALFITDYCPFCITFLPTFEDYSEKYPHFKFAIVDVTDDDSPLWDRYHVEVVPTLIAFNGGREVGRRDGARGAGLKEGDLKSLISELKTRIGQS